MYKSIVLLLSLLFILFISFLTTNIPPKLVAQSACPPVTSQYGSCIQTVSMGWVAFGGTLDPQRWETRIKLLGTAIGNPNVCSIHIVVHIYDPNPLPVSGGYINDAKQILVNYYDNRDRTSDRTHPKISTSNGISYDLASGESANLVILSSVANPLTVTGGSIQLMFFTTSPVCLNSRLPAQINYLAEQPRVGYTYTVQQNEPFSIAPKWIVTADGSSQGSPDGFIDMSLNIFNPSSLNPVTVHLVAYDQFGKVVAFTGSNGGFTSAIPDHTLYPLASWSVLLSEVLGPAMHNISGTLYVSATTGPIMVTAFRRIDLGMSAPGSIASLY